MNFYNLNALHSLQIPIPPLQNKRMISVAMAKQQKIIAIASFIFCVIAACFLFAKGKQVFFNKKIMGLEGASNQQVSKPEVAKTAEELSVSQPKAASPKNQLTSVEESKPKVVHLDIQKVEVSKTESSKNEESQVEKPKAEIANQALPYSAAIKAEIVGDLSKNDLNQAEEPKKEIIKEDEPQVESGITISFNLKGSQKHDPILEITKKVEPKTEIIQDEHSEIDLIQANLSKGEITNLEPKVLEAQSDTFTPKIEKSVEKPLEKAAIVIKPQTEVNKVEEEENHEEDEGVLDLTQLPKKHEPIIISAKKVRIKGKTIQEVQDKVLKEVGNVNKNSGVYDVQGRLNTEFNDNNNPYQTYLAIKDQKIVGFLMGEIQKSVDIEGVGIKGDRFNLYHFRVLKDIGNDKGLKEQIETKLLLDAMEKTKQLGLEYFSLNYCHSTRNEMGKLIYNTSEIEFYNKLEILLKKCHVICSEIKIKKFYDSDLEFWNHKTYNIKHFQSFLT